MAEFAPGQLIIRNTFWEVVAEDTAEDLPRHLRRSSDHCVHYANSGRKANRSYSDFNDSTSTAGTSRVGSTPGTSRAGSVADSDDVGSSNLNMAELATGQLIVRKTFWEVVEDAAQGLPRHLRRSSDHCVDYSNLGQKANPSYSDFNDATSTAGTTWVGSTPGTSRACSDVGSDDVGSWADMSDPPGTLAAEVVWTAPPTSYQVPAAAVAQMCSADCQSEEEEEEEGTTVIVRKCPGGLSRDKFLDTLDAVGLAGLYTFVYLPMNFEKGTAVGHAILNFTDPTSAAAAVQLLSSVVLSDKQLEASISDAKQSLSDLILRYRDSSVMHSSVPDDCKPALFSDGLMVPFPEPTTKLDPPVHPKEKKKSKRSSR